MKLLIHFILLVILINLGFTKAQWQQVVRLTNDSAVSGLSNNNTHCIASAGSDIHIVWYDDRDGNNEIYLL